MDEQKIVIYEPNLGNSGNAAEATQEDLERCELLPASVFRWMDVTLAFGNGEKDVTRTLPCFRGLALTVEIVATYEADDDGGFIGVLVGVTHVNSGLQMAQFSTVSKAVRFCNAISKLGVDWESANVEQVRSHEWSWVRERITTLRYRLEVASDV